jgi:hypothetical protein
MERCGGRIAIMGPFYSILHARASRCVVRVTCLFMCAALAHTVDMLARILNDDKTIENCGPKLLFVRHKSTPTPSLTICKEAHVGSSRTGVNANEHLTFQDDGCTAESGAEQGAGTMVGARRREGTEGETKREAQIPESEAGVEAQAEAPLRIPDCACKAHLHQCHPLHQRVVLMRVAEKQSPRGLKYSDLVSPTSAAWQDLAAFLHDGRKADHEPRRGSISGSMCHPTSKQATACAEIRSQRRLTL